MALVLVLTKRLRILMFAGLTTFVTPAWSTAQDPEDPRGLYESNGPLMRPSATPKAGEFRRRTPMTTKSRFAPGFRNYMGESEVEDSADRSAAGPGRAGMRPPSNFTDRLDFENEQRREQEGERESEPGFISTHAPSRFSDQERETRRDAYQEYLKERDPAKRAQLYREYLGKRSPSSSPTLGDRSTAHDILNSSGPGSLIGRPGLGQSRSGAMTNPGVPSTGPTAPRRSLFSPSGSQPRGEAGLFRRNDGPAPPLSTDSSARRPPTRSTGSAGQNFGNAPD